MQVGKFSNRLNEKFLIKRICNKKTLDAFNAFHIVDEYTEPVRIEPNKDGGYEVVDWKLAGNNTFLEQDIPKSSIDRMPIRIAASKLKGVVGPVAKYHSNTRLLSGESNMYKCDYFRLQYYPPDHFLSSFRKSRPAITCKPVTDLFINGKLQQSNSKTSINETQMKQLSSKFQNVIMNTKSKIARDYAVRRNHLRLDIKQWFIHCWCNLHGPEAIDEQIKVAKNGPENVTNLQYIDDHLNSKPGIAKDGYYMYNCTVFPDDTNKVEYREKVRESIKIIADKTWVDIYASSKKNSHKGLNWAHNINSRVNISVLNQYLSSAEVPYKIIKSKL